MRIERISPLTGKTNAMEIAVNKDTYLKWLYERNGLIQDIFPNLSPDEREFILTGYTPEDWAKIFPPEAEEE